ncbi:hypothetical protein [Nocardia sp. NPDC005366]|uniref:hypothetical protein n=1 Tax=Nocardia sp. NPDC005366 TaxID=3156878 RepID=UPI0033B85013
MSNRSPERDLGDARGGSDTEPVSDPCVPAEVRRDQRSYIKLSIDFLENRRTGPLSPVTKLALIELWIYCHRNRTNGIIPAAHAHRMVHKRLREVLAAAGCWQHYTCTPQSPCRHNGCTSSTPCRQDGYVMHDYGKHQSRYPREDGRRRDPRPYIKLAVDFLENHRTGPLSPVAKLALIQMWIYCHRNRTNGVLPLSAFRKIATTRVREMLLAAGSCHHHDDTTPTGHRHHVGTTAASRRDDDGTGISAQRGHDGGKAVPTRRQDDSTTAASSRHGVVTMHDYRHHQTIYQNPSETREKASPDSEYDATAKEAEIRDPATGPAGESGGETVRPPSRDARASHKSQVISTPGPYVGIPPPVGDAREEKHPDPPRPRPPSPPVRVAPRARHGGDDAADRINASAPEVPATAAMRRRVVARLAPNAVAVLAEPDADELRRERAQHEIDCAEAVIDARAEYLETGDLASNPEADLLFDPFGDNGFMRRMSAAQRPLPVPDPVTVGERRALAFRLAREHIDDITRYGGQPPGKAREAMRAELEALLEAGVSQDVLCSELRSMLEVGLWSASKLRERLSGDSA